MLDRESSSKPRILYCVSSVGLGHARRSACIADALRHLETDLPQIDWIAAEPVQSFLKARSEHVLEISNKLRSLSLPMENMAKSGRISDMAIVARKSADVARANYLLLRPLFGEYDLLIQDEFVETMFSFLWDKKANEMLPRKRAVITDYVKLETRSRNPINRLIMSYSNRLLRRAFLSSELRIFADDPRSLPQSSRLVNWVRKNFKIIGPIVGDIPSENKDELRKEIVQSIGPMRSEVRKKVITFSVGGTSIGAPLVDFAISNSHYLSERLDSVNVVLTGPRVSVKEPPWSEDLRIIPFTPDALRYFKLADCVVTQAGASTLNEVAALGVPCVCVPISNHWEQMANARRFSEDFGFVKLEYSELTKEHIARAIEEAMTRTNSKTKDSFNFSNQRKAAELILKFATSSR